ncbi:hypothetical protein FCM35_KLT07021 [Carex littledalei]|uniref:Uncharacterized protein n=1 Tax=Carex littledalei TaxID=544730 RepID=A0A833QKY2_9POAL|nr:hypothetical protein FCM35_KLT07021 [Carex littledalei]
MDLWRDESLYKSLLLSPNPLHHHPSNHPSSPVPLGTVRQAFPPWMGPHPPGPTRLVPNGEPRSLAHLSSLPSRPIPLSSPLSLSSPLHQPHYHLPSSPFLLQ